MIKSKYTLPIMLLTVMSLLLFSGCDGKQLENTTIQDNNSEIKANIEENIIESPNILREEGYNSVELNFYTISGNNTYSLEMDIELYSIYNSTEAYSTLDEAVEKGILKDYTNSSGKCSFLLKEGYKLNAKMNPSNKEELIGWEDYKSNFPFEVTATAEGNNKLNRFNITFDYASDIVATDVETLTFE